MRVTVSPEERAIIGVTIAYANARGKKIRLPPSLHPVLSPRSVLYRRSGLRGSPRDVILKSVDLHVQKDLQVDLRRWLAVIATQGPAAFSDDTRIADLKKALSALKTEIRSRGVAVEEDEGTDRLRRPTELIAAEVEAHLRSRIPGEEREHNQGEFYDVGGIVLRPALRDGRLIHDVAAESVAALLAYGTAIILDRNRGLAHRLGQCGWCGRFRLDFEGRPRMHCNEAHRLAYDRKMSAERMRAWRKRRRRREGPQTPAHRRRGKQRISSSEGQQQREKRKSRKPRNGRGFRLTR